MITIDPRTVEEIREHGRQAYPEECCGALLGTGRDGSAFVTRIEKMRNARGEERRRRYTIDPLEYVRVEREADREGIEILGFYHSHPDHPARPSEYDREHAMPFFHYVVLAVADGIPGDIGSFVLSEDRGTFEREELAVEAPEGVQHA
jgi:proteasome lid subunit RPN8/RPN11